MQILKAAVENADKVATQNAALQAQAGSNPSGANVPHTNGAS